MFLFFLLTGWMSKPIAGGPRWPVIAFMGAFLLLSVWAFFYGRSIRKKGAYLLQNVVSPAADLMLALDALAPWALSGESPFPQLLLYLAAAGEVAGFIGLLRADRASGGVVRAAARAVAFGWAALLIFAASVFTSGLFAARYTLISGCLATVVWYGFVDLWRSRSIRHRLQDAGVRLLPRKGWLWGLFALSVGALLPYLLGDALEKPWLRYGGMALGAGCLLLVLALTLEKLHKFGMRFFGVLLIRGAVFTVVIVMAFLLSMGVLLLVVDQEARDTLLESVSGLYSFAICAGLGGFFLYCLTTWRPTAEYYQTEADRALFKMALAEDADEKIALSNKRNAYQRAADILRERDE